MQENKLDYVTWDFDKVNEKSIQLADNLRAKGVGLVIPFVRADRRMGRCTKWGISGRSSALHALSVVFATRP